MSSDIDKLAWIRVENRRVLCVRSVGRETYYIPGGKREPGESDHDALTREIREELSVQVIRETISFVGVFSAQADGKPDGTVVKMTCFGAEVTGDLAPAAEIEELAWIEHSDRDKCSLVAREILDYLKELDLID